MAFKISDDCTSCGACREVCPVDAISEGESQYNIDAGLCTDCAECSETCPVEAIAQA